ncbi:g-type lectin s-receptor-like serine/threonine-protein kinase lecrk1 [Quercus suber]|uniref:Receptor-like serine/threonine-protein kinase n=1 Tax=Quercus suber TaxID=58331 RepID=A0AAW0L3P3_QUESU
MLEGTVDIPNPPSRSIPSSVWANRDDPPVPTKAILNFTSNGQLVLQSAQGAQMSIANSPGGETSASMLDSSKFVLYNSNNNKIWQNFDHPTDTLLPIQHLLVEKVLNSSLFDSNHSTDGYLAMYPVGTPYTIDYGYWNYKKPGQGNNVRLNLDDNGHLHLDNGNGTAGIVDLNLGDNPTKAIFTAEAQPGQSSIKPGSFLTVKPTATTNSSWLSPSGLYAFGFHRQGNGYAVGIFVEGIPQKTVVWTANRDDPPVPADATLNFTSDGQLVLQSAQQGTKRRITNSTGVAATSASMLDSGNFVLNSSVNNTIWQSFEQPTDTLLPSQHLSVNEVLISSVSDSNHSTGRFLLLMQQDGYLAMYPVGTPYTLEYGYWNYVTPGPENNAKLNLDDNGHLYIDSITGTAGIVDLNLGENSTKGLLYLLRIDADGILRLYSHSMDQNGTWSVTWSQPDDKCLPKGLCGLNAYCVNTNQSLGCNCLPGFAPTNQSEKSSGCERNFTADSCKGMSYTMELVNNTKWEYKNISVLSLTQEACKAACLEDCKCDAALFKDGECKMQALPFRFVTLHQDDSFLALFKVGISTPTTDRNVSKKSKKEVIIISVSLVAFAIVLVISGVVMYRYRVWACKKESNHGNIVLSEEDSLRSFTYAELEKSVDSNVAEEEAILEEWAYHCFECGELGKLLNEEEVDKKQFERITKVALWCIQYEPSLRPSMKQVLQMLEGTVDIPDPPSRSIPSSVWGKE